MLGLSVSDVVSVAIAMAPVAAPERNFGINLILGDSQVVNVQERLRLYGSYDALAADLGSAAPEAAAAKLYFGQNPTPAQVYVGRWASANTHGLLIGSPLSAAQQAIGNFTAVAAGGVDLVVDGTAYNLANLNFSAQTTLNGVAQVVQTALGGAATVSWDSAYSRFEVKSASTGAASVVPFATAGAGTDVSGLLGLTAAASGGYSVPGMLAETLDAAVALLAGLSTNWYGLSVAAAAAVTDAEYVKVAGVIEAISVSRLFGCTTQEAAAMLTTSSTDLAALLQAGNYSRTFCQYSSSSQYAAASILGRMATVDFTASDTAITLKFKQEPGVAAEALTESQAAALNSKNCNVLAGYDNGATILQQGTMANGYFIDEMQGVDWLQNYLQTAVFNYLYTTNTKVPQTQAGMTAIVNVINQALTQAVACGFVAPGVWTGPPVGALDTGDTLTTGFYVYQTPLSQQSAADRQARKAPAIQCAIKLAGAVHFANVLVNVNR
jgi:hypothetical protein